MPRKDETKKIKPQAETVKTESNQSKTQSCKPERPTKQTLKTCIVDGVKVTEAIRKISDLDVGNWYACPVPALLGVPLMVKRLRPSDAIENHEPAVFMMVTIKTGLAPSEWMSNAFQKLGQLEFKRKDNIDLTSQMWWDLYDYIFGVLMDAYGDYDMGCLPESMKTKLINRKAFQSHIMCNYGRMIDTSELTET